MRSKHRPKCPHTPPARALTDNAADTVRGILLVAVSYLILTIGDTAAKWAILASGVAWAMLWRGVFGAAAVALMTGMTQGDMIQGGMIQGGMIQGEMTRGAEGLARLRPVRWKMVALRSGLSSFTTIAWYLSWQSLQLADTYALGFTAPLIMTLLAIPLLGERIRWRRILSTVIGFAGVLVMVRPGGSRSHPPCCC
jgi:drug/metabolite transporter (DMT)-like permease